MLRQLSAQEQDRLLSAYDYELPEELIAQNPAVPRDSARLLVVDSTRHRHHRFYELPQLLRSGDLLVMNNTRVIPARLYGHKQSGATVEVLLLEERQHNQWLALVKPGRRLPPGATIVFAGNATDPLSATVLETDAATGGRLLQFDVPQEMSLLQVLDQYGQVPLPPYITNSQAASEQYQTVYAEQPGAVAAPTAGLHFTPELLTRLKDTGIRTAFVTLHVGVGTFRPVEVEDITTHKMHGEWVEVSADTVAQIRETQAQGGRVFAVGTTVVRSLEGAAVSGELQPFCGKTNLFIYPGYQWRVVEGLITNFHLPKSSLLMLVSALIGRQRLLELYQEAIAERYRFYSFGDAMLILPQFESMC
ncbi:S-adenosylmethionine--tRNA ribosyltransferase-isomerase [Gloeocapsa sp. PCC 7428]|uniref:tRNA preQ1(34) S-adenosylmethionine ribosyltransferase-isomerase QueA n=1 Tax=Gloeocapsa sp. PCC 7428 TaxID=1173026 RepID=UPI0002A5ED04|nr:tRNA preQ1(34) S-adenosylmethionine ribosyltransferase-isomerase QueA [Gloeocapsa sp. PCC 7428]AFZ33198.1 S-adenosylmethionine--tRNA ribosyltransferase-isomerase [Gloeocapsa sp. PCC 7428]